MLRNVDSLLPLKKVGQKIALIGWWANDNQNAQGCGVVWGNSSFVVTLHDGIASAMKDPQNELKTVEGSLVEAPTPRGIADATAAAQWADVVVLALGEPTNYSGEAQSRTDIIIPHAQQALAEAVSAVGKPTVVLLKNGRALALEGAVKNAQAIMVTWFLGKKSGEAIADLLFGDHSPEGRLPVSFTVRSGQQPYLLQSMCGASLCVSLCASLCVSLSARLSVSMPYTIGGAGIITTMRAAVDRVWVIRHRQIKAGRSRTAGGRSRTLPCTRL
jgi:beta-glucosidase